MPSDALVSFCGPPKRGHHFAAQVNRHAKTRLRPASEMVMSRLAADHQPLCFMRREDRVSHRCSGYGKKVSGTMSDEDGE